MSRSWWWKFGMVTAVTLLSIWYLIPTYYSLRMPSEDRNDLAKLQAQLPRWAPSADKRLSLGLDLQGGIHMVMQVDTETALRKRTERRGVVIANYLNGQAALGGVSVSSDPEKRQVTITLNDASKLDAVRKELEGFDDFNVVDADGGRIVLELQEAYATSFKQESVDQAMLVIRKRIDKWGVAEVEVRKVGTDSIQVSLPGQKDPEQAKELIGTTAQLEFRVVDDSSQVVSEVFRSTPPPAEAKIDLATDLSPYLVSPNREALLSYLASIKEKLPQDKELLLECQTASGTTAEVCDSYRTYLVERAAGITGDSLASAQARPNQFNEPEVLINFDANGAREFELLTEKNVGKRMAIVLDDTVNTAPRINEKIAGGSAVITLGGVSTTGEDPLAEAQTLALVLKAGALPAPVAVGEIRQVGASLGEELINRGSWAVVLGLGLVVLAMAIYYRMAGLIADVALTLNALLILAALAFLQATLTLPGIAGFVLTLGMAVDANVLINERIREELRAGKSARAAVDQGYDRAFWTIFDSHVTTLIAAVILFFTGSGPVQGFATTLTIGLIASMFTAIVVTRLFTTALVHGRNAQTVSI
jgi:preprotein translocase subunit SecD